MARGKKRFALIWWNQSRKKDVIQLTCIRDKKHHHVDAIVHLCWKNYQTKQETKESAKILAISDDENGLHKIIVTSEGMIHCQTHQVFSEDVLNQENSMKKENILIKNIKRSNNKQVEEQIARDYSIFASQQGQSTQTYQSTVPSSTLTRPSATSSGPLKIPFESFQENSEIESQRSISICSPSENLNASSHQKRKLTTKSIEILQSQDHILDKSQFSVGSPCNNESNSNSEISDIGNEDTLLFSHKIEIGKVTARDIQFQRALLKAMENTFAYQNRNSPNSVISPLDESYFKEGETKKQLAEGCGFYLPKNIHKEIELKAVMNNDWKILIRETLLLVYGQYGICNYSATGVRGNRPGINCQLFKGLKDWAKDVVKPPPSKEEIITCINKIAYNKRKSKMQKKSKKQKVPKKCTKQDGPVPRDSNTYSENTSFQSTLNQISTSEQATNINPMYIPVSDNDSNCYEQTGLQLTSNCILLSKNNRDAINLCTKTYEKFTNEEQMSSNVLYSGNNENINQDSFFSDEYGESSGHHTSNLINSCNNILYNSMDYTTL